MVINMIIHLVEYVKASKKVKIICREHGVFEQSPNKHKSGNGCPTCGLGWTNKSIISYINDIRNQDVLEMDPVELNMLDFSG